MSVWVAILVVCATADDCTIAYFGDQVEAWPTEAECNAIASGMVSGARLEAQTAPMHVVTAGCIEIVIPPLDDPA